MTRLSGLVLLAAVLTAVNADLYTKKSPVLQVTGKTYESLIAKSNHTSVSSPVLKQASSLTASRLLSMYSHAASFVVHKEALLLTTDYRFYAPWCGHCQNLKPAYEKAATNLKGLANVAAVNCDDDANKPFCGSMGVQGFPTLKIITPTKAGKPAVEDYQGPRSAKGIVDHVVERIPNYVKRLQDKTLDAWLKESNETTKVILFSDKGTTSPLLRALAIDFLGTVKVGQVRSREATAVETFGVTSFPTLILLPGGTKDSIMYNGEMKKDPIMAFISQIALPNLDPATSSKNSKASSSKKPKSKAPESTGSFGDWSYSVVDEDKAATASAADSPPTESPEPFVPPTETPITVPFVQPSLPELGTPEDLEKTCLGEKTGTCILALLSAPATPESELPAPALAAQASLSQLSEKHKKRQAKLFPFYEVPSINTAAKTLRNELGLKDENDVEVIAVNGRRGWWRRYSKDDFGATDVEDWIDAIRLGEGKKEKIPDGVVKEVTEASEKAAPTEESEKPAEPEKEEIKHSEL